MATVDIDFHTVENLTDEKGLRESPILSHNWVYEVDLDSFKGIMDSFKDDDMDFDISMYSDSAYADVYALNDSDIESLMNDLDAEERNFLANQEEEEEDDEEEDDE